jgi:hypothetical protein
MFRIRAVTVRLLSALLVMAASGIAPRAMAAELIFDLKVDHGRVADAMRLIRVSQGDVVRLRWTVDRPLSLHLHGYDIEKHVEPGAIAELTFTAFATGRFPIHLHEQPGRAGARAHDEEELVMIEVYPR